MTEYEKAMLLLAAVQTDYLSMIAGECPRYKQQHVLTTKHLAESIMKMPKEIQDVFVYAQFKP